MNNKYNKLNGFLEKTVSKNILLLLVVYTFLAASLAIAFITINNSFKNTDTEKTEQMLPQQKSVDKNGTAVVNANVKQKQGQHIPAHIASSKTFKDLVTVVSRYRDDRTSKYIAKEILSACQEAKVKDPLKFAALVESESGFNHFVTHADSRVIGMCAINTRYYKAGSNASENLHYGAKIFADNLKRANGNYYQALAYYKGNVPLGQRQARAVMKKYYQLKNICERA